MDYDQAFGSVFRALRLHKGLTQEAFQPIVTERYIRNIEKGEYSPSIALVRNLCGILDVNPAMLITLVEAKHTGEDWETLIKAANLELKSAMKTLKI